MDPAFNQPAKFDLAEGVRGLARAATEFIQMIEGAFRLIDENRDTIVDFWERMQTQGDEDAWRYLFDQLPALTTISLKAALELGERIEGDQAGWAIAGILTDGLTEPQFLSEINEATGRTPMSVEKREQLKEGLRHFGGKRPHLALPLLINPLEGLFWQMAERRGLVVCNAKGKWQTTNATSKPGTPVGGLEKLIKIRELGMDPGFRRFLLGLTYGGSGNAFRHGTTEVGWQMRASCLVVGLTGYLELEGQMKAQGDIRAAFHRVYDQRRAAQIAEAA